MSSSTIPKFFFLETYLNISHLIHLEDFVNWDFRIKSGPHWKSSGANAEVKSFLSTLSSIDFVDSKKLFDLKDLGIPFYHKRLLDLQRKERKDIFLAKLDAIQHQIPQQCLIIEFFSKRNVVIQNVNSHWESMSDSNKVPFIKQSESSKIEAE